MENLKFVVFDSDGNPDPQATMAKVARDLRQVQTSTAKITKMIEAVFRKYPTTDTIPIGGIVSSVALELSSVDLRDFPKTYERVDSVLHSRSDLFQCVRGKGGGARYLRA
jgi:hypothetical protein